MHSAYLHLSLCVCFYMQMQRPGRVSLLTHASERLPGRYVRGSCSAAAATSFIRQTSFVSDAWHSLSTLPACTLIKTLDACWLLPFRMPHDAPLVVNENHASQTSHPQWPLTTEPLLQRGPRLSKISIKMQKSCTWTWDVLLIQLAAAAAAADNSYLVRRAIHDHMSLTWTYLIKISKCCPVPTRPMFSLYVCNWVGHIYLPVKKSDFTHFTNFRNVERCYCKISKIFTRSLVR